MDFMNRGNRPVQQNTQPNDFAGQDSPKTPATRKSAVKDGALAKFGFIGFIAVITILIVAVVLSLALHKDNASTQVSKVDKTKLQAVFLNGGQVYFGKISDINSKNISLGDIYYLRVNQQVQPNQTTTTTTANDISLVKLGCELHGPEDSMVINQEQVIFWENLKEDGQVAKAVAEYVKNNPSGQKCETQQGTSTGTGTGTTTGTGTSTTGTTTKNP